MAPAKKPALRVRVLQMPHAKGLPLPAYQSDGAAGMDLLAAVPENEPLVLSPGSHALVPTGLKLELPKGMEAQVRPRSGLALKHGITVLNSPGTVDSDYRGEVGVILINLSRQPFTIGRGERIAQLVMAAVSQARLEVAQAISETVRGAGGFGSTGTKGRKKKPIPANPKSAQRADLQAQRTRRKRQS